MVLIYYDTKLIVVIVIVLYCIVLYHGKIAYCSKRSLVSHFFLKFLLVKNTRLLLMIISQGEIMLDSYSREFQWLDKIVDRTDNHPNLIHIIVVRLAMRVYNVWN